MIVPIICIIGEFGSGKTLYATYLARKFALKYPEKTVFTNYELFNIPFTKYEFSDLKKEEFPEWLKNGLLIIDEIHLGTDAYDFMKKDVRQIMKFITQIRKFDLQVVMCTPVFDFINKRLRSITNYIITMDDMVESGVVNGNIYRVKSLQPKFIKSFEHNLKSVFGNYNTKEIISN